jgi:phosphinothricin acetyltransferase
MLYRNVSESAFSTEVSDVDQEFAIMEPVTVRTAETSDLPQIAAIYDEQVRTAISTFDLEPPGQQYWEARLASTSPGDHLLVAVADSGVVGYAYSSSYRPRPAYARTREVSVYLAGEARARGIGRALYEELLRRLHADGVHQVLAVIALPNDASEALHRACGFSRVGVLPEVGWKFDRWIDTAVWGLTL